MVVLELWQQFKLDGGGIGQGVMRRKLFEVNGGGAGAAGSSSTRFEVVLDKESGAARSSSRWMVAVLDQGPCAGRRSSQTRVVVLELQGVRAGRKHVVVRVRACTHVRP